MTVFKDCSGKDDFKKNLSSFCFIYIFGDKVSKEYSPAWPRACCVDQASLELKRFLLPPSQLLGLKVYATMPVLISIF